MNSHYRFHLLSVTLGFVGLVVTTGCQGPQMRTIGLSVEGRPIQCEVMGTGGYVVLIMATIHGNEAAGTPLVWRLADHLAKHAQLLDGRRVVLVPVANPDGYFHNTRHNVNGVDLNRNFPAGNFASTRAHGANPLSEPESRAIKAILDEYQPNQVVSIHQPLACIDYDGPAGDLAKAMGAWTDLPVKRLGSRPGSLGSYAGLTRRIPIITLELPASASDLTDDALWEHYGGTLLAAIRFTESL